MALPFVNYAALATQGNTTGSDIISGIRGGLELGQLPANMREDLKRKQLLNALAEIQAKYEPKNRELTNQSLEIQNQYAPRLNDSALNLQGAQANLANAHANSIPLELQIKIAQAMQKQEYAPSSNIGKLQRDYQYAIQQFGQDSPQAQQILAQIQKENTLPGQAGSAKANNYNQAFDEARKVVSNVDNLLGYVNTFENAYSKAHTGPTLGQIPSSGIFGSLANTEDQIADNSVQNLVKSLVGTFPGRVTNTELQFLQNTKPTRQLTPQAKDILVNNLKAVSLRSKEYLPFINEAQKLGIPLNEAVEVFEKYKEENPVINVQEGKAIPIKNKSGNITSYQNLNKWQSYLNKYANSPSALSLPTQKLPQSNQQISALTQANASQGLDHRDQIGSASGVRPDFAQAEQEAEAAIARGADREKVMARLNQLRNQM